MDERRQITSSQSDELDLLNLVRKAWFFFQKFGKTIIFFSIGGFVLGIAFYLLLPKQYESKLILHSSILTNEEEIEIIKTWSDLLGKGEYASLANTWNVSQSLLSGVFEISAREIQKLYSEKNPNGFIVNVMVLDTAILKNLQDGIIYGLENSYYVKERVETKKENLNDLISKVTQEITNLDSTKKTVTDIIRNKNTSTSSLLIDVSGINSEWVELNEKLLDYKEELKFIGAVQVLQSFNKSSKPEEPKILKSLFFGLAFGAFLGYLIALYKNLRLSIQSRSADQD